jgi:hypothetical protein
LMRFWLENLQAQQQPRQSGVRLRRCKQARVFSLSIIFYAI